MLKLSASGSMQIIFVSGNWLFICSVKKPMLAPASTITCGRANSKSYSLFMYNWQNVLTSEVLGRMQKGYFAPGSFIADVFPVFIFKKRIEPRKKPKVRQKRISIRKFIFM